MKSPKNVFKIRGKASPFGSRSSFKNDEFESDRKLGKDLESIEAPSKEVTHSTNSSTNSAASGDESSCSSDSDSESSYSGSSTGVVAKKKRGKFGFRVWAPRLRRNKKDDNSVSSYSSSSVSSSSYSSSSSSSSEESFAVNGLVNDKDNPEAAAEALGHDLEALGYNLSCESFITRGSSKLNEEERYKPKKRRTKKHGKKKLDPCDGEEDGDDVYDLVEENEDGPPKKIDVLSSCDSSLSNPSAAQESLQTNTSSKLKLDRKVVVGDNYKSLKQMMKSSHRGDNDRKMTIPPPAMAKMTGASKKDPEGAKAGKKDHHHHHQFDEKNKRHGAKEDHLVVDEAQPPVIIEGMSVLFDAGADSEHDRRRSKMKKTRESHPEEEEVKNSLTEGPMKTLEEAPRRRMFGFGLGRNRTTSYQPRVPNLSAAPNNLAALGLAPLPEKTNSNARDSHKERALKIDTTEGARQNHDSFRLPRRMGKDEDPQTRGRDRKCRQRRNRGRMQSDNMTAGDDKGEQETMAETLAPGQIEVTFNSSLVDSELIPVAQLDVRSRHHSLSPRRQIEPRPNVKAESKRAATPKGRLQRFFFNRQRHGFDEDHFATGSKVGGFSQATGSLPGNSNKFKSLNLYASKGRPSTNVVRTNSFSKFEPALGGETSRFNNPNIFDRSRTAPAAQTDHDHGLSMTVNDLVNQVFLPKGEQAKPVGADGTTKPRGLLQDWFNLDMLGNMDWNKPHEHTTRESPGEDQLRESEENTSLKIESVVEREGQPESRVTPEEPAVEKELSWTTPTNALRGLLSPDGSLANAASPAENREPENQGTVATESLTRMEATLEKKKRLPFFKRLRLKSKSGMSTGLSSGQPSSFYPVVVNEAPLDQTAVTARPALSKRFQYRIEQPRAQQMPQLAESLSEVSFTEYLNQPPPKNPSQSYLSSFGSYQEGVSANRYLETDKSSEMGDTWAEIADASLIVERAMDRLDTFKSEDTDDPGKLKHLLSVMSDDQSIGDVEKALGILKKHALRLGVKETDLLLAVESHDTAADISGGADSDLKSYKSMTIGEELLNVFNMFTGNNTAQQKQQKKK